MFKRVTVIVNPISGNHRDRQYVVDMVQRRLSSSGGECNVVTTAARGDATTLAHQAVSEKRDLVVVLGGDGTLNEVATGLVKSEVPLAVIPMGSGNGFARSLGVPNDPHKACEVIFDGKVASIDVGRVNEQYFFLVAGVGFDAVVGEKFDRLKTRGPLSYFSVGAREFLAYRPKPIQVTMNGKTIGMAPFVIAVANGEQYGNNAIIAPGAKMNDGLFNISVVHQFTLFNLVTQFRRLFTGNLRKYRHASFDSADRVKISRQTDGVINVDGEPVHEQADLHLSLLPKSLKVIAPNNSAGLT